MRKSLRFTATSGSDSLYVSASRVSKGTLCYRLGDELGFRTSPEGLVDQPQFDLSDTHAAAFCPACGAGYTAGHSRCADCDQELLARSQIEAKLAATGEAVELPSPEAPELEETAGRLLEFDLSDPDAVAFCPSCASGYRATAIRCADCDRDLLPRSWVEARSKEPAMEPNSAGATVLLADVENTFKAQLLASVLSDEGVWFASEPSAWGAARFLVRARDLDFARQALSDLDEIQDPPPESPDEG